MNDIMNDIMDDGFNELCKQIIEAKEQLILKGVKANIILIDEKLAYSPPFNCDMCVIPPMICGLEIKPMKLPEGITFALLKGTTEREKIAKEAVKEFAERLKYTLTINNEGNDEFLDFAYTIETIDELSKTQGE